MLFFGCEFLKYDKTTEAINAFQMHLKIYPESLLAHIGLKKAHTILKNTPECEKLQKKIDEIVGGKSIVKPFGPHDPYSCFIDHFLKERYPDMSPITYLENRRGAVNALVEHFARGNNDKIQSAYTNQEIQEAYLLRYFPYYIEPIYRELSILPFNFLLNHNEKSISLCLYGCGPAPELLGIIRYIDKTLSWIDLINVYYFEKNDWDDIRKICTYELSAKYMTRHSIEIKSQTNTIDLLDFTEPSRIEAFPEIRTATIHIFHNCLRDLYGTYRDEVKVTNILKNILLFAEKGSILIIVDLNYSNIKNIMKKFSEMAINESNGIIIRDNTYETTRVNPNLIKSKEIIWFEKELRPKKGTDYYSLVLMRV